MNKKILGTLFIASIAIIITGCTTSQQETQEPQAQNIIKMDEGYIVDPSDNVHSRDLLENIEKGELSEEEKNGLILMREEEKLAHDVYTVLYEKWGQKTFNNIARSEQTHTDTVKVLLDKYDVKDPVVDNTIGVFTSPQMQSLYDDLVAQGNKSLTDALTVGITIEDLDIKDLDKLLQETDNEDIQTAYQNLIKGSRNHMRAFERQLEKNGQSYDPQYITEEMYEQIITGDQERGGVDATGKNMQTEDEVMRGPGMRQGSGMHRNPGSSGTQEQL